MVDTLEREEIDLDLIMLWDLAEEECECESEHRYSQGFCTVKAEYAVVNSCKKTSSLWCASRYREFLKTATSRRCMHCKKMLVDCWQVREL